MADTLRIEIPIEVLNNTDPELSQVVKKLDKMKESADKANSSTKKASETVSKFDKSQQKTQKTLASWAKEKYQVLLEAKDKISPILQTVGGGLRNLASRSWSVTMKAVDLATAPIRGVINLLRNPVFQVGAVLGVSVGLADTINTYKDFEAAMSQVQAISGATSTQLTTLTAKAKEMGATTKFTATQSAEAFNYMAMAGWDAEQMLGGIEGILNLAAASGEDLGTTSDIVTDALTAFGLKASDATHFSDVLAQASSNANTDVGMMGETFKYVASMAGTLGYSIEDVALMTGLMANSGIKSSQAGTSLNAVLTRLSTNASGAADTIAKLGVNFYDSTGNARPLATVMGELREATKGMNQEQKANLANTVAGMEAQKGFLTILNASEEDYNKLAEAIANANGASERMANTMQDNLAGDITLFQSAVDGLKISLGERMSNSWLRDIVQWLTLQVPKVEQAFDNALDFIEVRLDRAKRKFKEISATDEWQNANFFGKAKILWDDFIIEPFKEWWKTTGKAKLNVIAGNIGEALGTGITVGIATLLGIDVSETINEGSTLGASFAKGFSEGFDFDFISEKLFSGISSLFSNAAKLLPGGESADLSSLLSLGLLMKLGSPLFGLGKGAFGIGKSLLGSGGGSSMLGGLLGSSATGSGLLGKSAMLAINLGAGNLAGGASMSAAGLSATGLGAGAGAIAAGATLISSGIDAYKAFKSTDKAEKSAYGESAAWKAGGVAAGAAAGAALGSVIPGIGTAVGALVGAGVGGIAGWIKGNKVKEEYHENVEEMKKEAERAKRIYEVTGLSIDKVRFANEDLNDAMKDTNLSVEELANFIQEDMAKVAEQAFGDITLSLSEVKQLAEEIVFGSAIEDVTEFAKATENANSSFSTLKISVNDLKKNNWKVSLGMKLDETERDDYKKAIDNFTKSASQYIEDNHYQATVALKLITGGTGSTAGIDNLYSGMKTQIDELSQKLADSVEIALTDGVITLDEQEEILNLQQQIENITGKLNAAREEAQLDMLKVKYSGGSSLSVESFNAMQEELKAQVEAWEENYDSAFELTLTSLNLQLSEGAITQEEFDAAVKEATDGYTAQLNSVNARVREFNLEAIAGAWDEQLNGILPEIEGSTSEKLSAAMDRALLIKPNASEWTQEDVSEWFGLDALASSDTSAFENIYKQLLLTAGQVPEKAKQELLANYQNSVPTAEEIKAAIDWDSLSNNELNAVYEDAGATMINSGVQQIDMSLKEWAEMFNEDYEESLNKYAENIRQYLIDSRSEETLSNFTNKYLDGKGGNIAFNAPISNEYYSELMANYNTTGTEAGTSFNNGVLSGLSGGSALFRTGIQSQLTLAAATPYSISPTVNITPSYNILGSGPQFPYAAGKKATGGYVSGKQLSWVGEEGPEAIIPLVPSRRGRAISLYEEVGKILGIGANANGGIVGGSNSAKNGTDYNLFKEAIRNAPIGNYEATDDNTEGTPVYEASGVVSDGGAANNHVEVSVQVSPEFVINGSSGQSEEDIMAIIRKNMKAMADELGGEIADRLESVFSNMPVVKEA